MSASNIDFCQGHRISFYWSSEVMVEWGLEGGVIDWKAIIWTKLTSRTHLVHIVHLVCQVHLVQNKRWVFSREPERGGGGFAPDGCLAGGG